MTSFVTVFYRRENLVVNSFENMTPKITSDNSGKL